MILMIATDPRFGVAFSNRRVSRDRALCGRILQRAGDKPLWMSPYSEKIFEHSQKIRCAPQPMECALEGEFCFVEEVDSWMGKFDHMIEKIILFQWDKPYPFDQKFAFPKGAWIKESQQEFPGYSHETIKEEVYLRET